MHHMEKVTSQRAYSLEDAWLIGCNEAEKNNIEPCFKLLSETHQNGMQLSTYLCATNNNTTKISSLGGASGFDKQAKIKAFYESLEKSLSYTLYKNNQIAGTHWFSSDSSPSTSYLINKDLMPKLLLQGKYQHHAYPWVELTHYQNPCKKIFYPLSLIYTFVAPIKSQNEPVTKDCLSELSNDTGLAIGATPEEAIIHGVNQWVERDAYSLFLLKTILHKNPTPARIIFKETLPDDLSKIILAIENHFNENLIIIDITSDITIPTFAVSFTKQNMLLQPQGFGASLSKDLALKQALFESMQYKDRYNSNADAYHKENFTYFANMPLLLKAMKGDIVHLIEQQLYISIEWKDIPTYSLDKNLEQQISLMVELLAKQGTDIYSNVLYQSDTGVSITYILIPQLENFSLIRDGKFSLIKSRGRGVLQC